MSFRDGTFCVGIQETSRTEVKPIPLAFWRQNPSFQGDSVHAMFITIDNNSKNVSWRKSTSVNHWSGNTKLYLQLDKLKSVQKSLTTLSAWNNWDLEAHLR